MGNKINFLSKISNKMAKNKKKTAKSSDFKEVKSRLGKAHLRKYKSSDEKLLSNLKNLKKSVKLLPQSITVKKDSLNVTSRRLTFQELVAKSRHTSENVRNHALMGFIEFIRRYQDEARENLYGLLQVCCGMLVSEYPRLRDSSKNLLVSILTTFCSDGKISEKLSEVIYLHLVQGLMASKSSDNKEYNDDINTIIGLIIDKFHYTLSFGYDVKLLNVLLEKQPSPISYKHFNCVYSLAKLTEFHSKSIVSYTINVLYNIINSENWSDSTDPSTKAECNRTEIECLTTSSVVVKSFKLLVLNKDFLEKNDYKVVYLLLSSDLQEFEHMTQKGKETFEKLFSELILLKAQLSINLLFEFDKHHIALLAPLIHLESVFRRLKPQEIVYILFLLFENFSVRDLDWDLKLKSEFIPNILNFLQDSKLTQLDSLKSYLHQFKLNSGNFTEKIPQSFDCGTEEIKCTLTKMVSEIVNNLFKYVESSPSVWPLVLYFKGISPSLFTQIFPKSTQWNFLHHGTVFSVFNGKFQQIPLDFDHLISHFIANSHNTNPHDYAKVLLEVCLYMSKVERGYEFYYKLTDLASLTEENYANLARIYVNLNSNERIIGFLSDHVLKLLKEQRYGMAKKMLEVLVYHVFNYTNRLDEFGRIIIQFDPQSDLLEKVNSFTTFLSKIIYEFGNGADNGSVVTTQDKEEDRNEINDILEFGIKMLIDKYILTLNKMEDDGLSGNSESVERLLKDFYEKIGSNFKDREVIFKKILTEYFGKDSIPNWLTSLPN
uniref:Pre-rRNA-processing protein Ipi1 N-terminal domain-containing protein n=1 Tax=Theileria annulata TaxID=5874 RepID=A0A3B0NCW2_THEAN